MKKFTVLLVGLMLLSVFLSAVESEPSAIVGYVAYECQTGERANNNFVAMPLQSEFTTAKELGLAYEEKINVVSNWLPETQAWESMVFDGDFWIGKDFDIFAGHAYMISVYEEGRFYCVGELVEQPQYDLIFGSTSDNNFIMVPLNRPDLDKASVLGEDIGDVNTVNTWTATTQSWNTTFYDELEDVWLGEDFSLSIATPVMIGITSPKVWPKD